MKALAAMLTVACLLLTAHAAEAALPMITDDTGTQGRGKFQLELAGEHDRDKEDFSGGTIHEYDYAVAAVLTAGLMDNLDLAVGVPYLWNSTSDDLGNSSRVDGVGDTALVAKWKFLEKAGLSFALKPFITLPSGNDAKVLGEGKVDFGVFFLTSAEFEPWSVHFNLGYDRNLNSIGERTNIWRASAAAVYALSSHWKLCADTGIQTNTDKTSETEPAYMLVGIIYAPAENFELAFGVKQGITNTAQDLAFIPGLTYRW